MKFAGHSAVSQRRRGGSQPSGLGDGGDGGRQQVQYRTVVRSAVRVLVHTGTYEYWYLYVSDLPNVADYALGSVGDSPIS